MDVSPYVHGAKRLWANRLWCEMSSVGRNFYEANRPWGEMSIRGAKRPWGELSVGRKVLTPDNGLDDLGRCSARW